MAITFMQRKMLLRLGQGAIREDAPRFGSNRRSFQRLAALGLAERVEDEFDGVWTWQITDAGIALTKSGAS